MQLMEWVLGCRANSTCSKKVTERGRGRRGERAIVGWNRRRIKRWEHSNVYSEGGHSTLETHT